MRPPAVRRVQIDNDRRRGALPGPVIHRVAPQSSDPRLFSAPIQHRQRRVVAEDFVRRHHGFEQKLVQRLQPPGRALDPVHQRRTIEMDALTGQHLGLTVQRQMPRELRDGDVRQQRGRRQAPVNRARGCRRLHDRGFTGAAAVFRPADAFDPNDRRRDVQHLTDVFADPVQFALTTRANVTPGLDDDVFARQVDRKAADVARGLRPHGLRQGLLSSRHGVWFGFDRTCRQIAKPERQLRLSGIALFRTRAIQCPLQRLQHRAEFLVLGAQSGDRLDQDVGIAWQ